LNAHSRRRRNVCATASLIFHQHIFANLDFEIACREAGFFEYSLDELNCIGP
jgi:hypothetical protein